MSNTLTKPSTYATIARALDEQRAAGQVGELSAFEARVILLMRAIANGKACPMIVLQYLGNAWRVSETRPSQWMRK